MILHLATLTVGLGTGPAALAGVEAWCGDAPGTLLGCWTTELGDLNRILVLQGFADDAASDAERRRALDSTDPYGCAAQMTAMSVDRCLPFPGSPPIVPGAHGPVYEVRTYTLRPGALPTLLAAWTPMLPTRMAHSPLTVAMHTLDGAPRIVHIWPYRDLVERARLRGEAVAKGIWPPKTASQIAAMHAAIALPAAFSPLR